jgi:hypothetical protein
MNYYFLFACHIIVEFTVQLYCVKLITTKYLKGLFQGKQVKKRLGYYFYFI